MTSRTESGSAAGQVSRAVEGFTKDFRAFRDDVNARLQQQEERLTMFDRKSLAPARPALATSAEGDAPHQKAFDTYLRSGDDAALRGIELEGKAMATSGDGGYLVDPQTAETISGQLRAGASIRRIAKVVHVEATSYDVIIDQSDMGAGWGTEAGPQAETGTPVMDRISIPLHELSAMPKASQRLLDDSAFDLEGWLAERIADKFARAEAAAFVTGDGDDKPRGFLDHAAVPQASWSWDSLGYVTTGADGAFAASAPGDALIDLVYALGAQYRAGASFVMNSRTAGEIRKIKDADGRFLWSDGLAAGEPARLLGYPVLVAEDMPDIGSGSFAVAFGDFAKGYTVAERPDLRVLRDPFSAKPHVLFYATKRVGGDVSDFAAIKLLKSGTS